MGELGHEATAEELAVSAAGLAGRDEARVRARGRVLLEVTSNMSRPGAHGFSERLGFERTSYRFRKPLGS